MRTINRLGWPGALVAMLLLWGAPARAAGEACAVDEDCAADEYCAQKPCPDIACDPDASECPVVECELEGECVSLRPSGVDACVEDADCPTGYVCDVVGGVGCATVACPPDEPCPEPEPCENQVFMGCVPAPCTDDADCGEGMVCLSVSYEICSASTCADIVCPEGAECPEPEPCDTRSECEQRNEAFCAPSWVAPCQADADCGEGFNCVQGEQCSCDGGGANVPSDGGDPQEQPEPSCTCEPSGEMYCQPQEITCAQDSDCPEGWTCAETPSTGACSYDATTGEEQCTETEPGTPMCAPPYWDSWGGSNGDYQDALERATGAEGEIDLDSGEPPAAPQDDNSDGDEGADAPVLFTCASGQVSSGTAVLLGLALGLLMRVRRRG